MKYLLSIAFVIAAQICLAQGYIYLADGAQSPNDSIKIESSNLNRFVDSTGMTERALIWPSYYEIQHLPDGRYFQFYLQDSSKIATELEYVDGLLTSFESFWFDRKKRLESHYLNGMKTGTWTSYFSTGKISQIFYYEFDWHREFLSFYTNGHIRHHGIEHDIGQRDYRYWETFDYYPNGRMKQTGFTNNGYKVGTWIYFDRSGNEESKIEHMLEDRARIADSDPTEK